MAVISRGVVAVLLAAHAVTALSKVSGRRYGPPLFSGNSGGQETSDDTFGVVTDAYQRGIGWHIGEEYIGPVAPFLSAESVSFSACPHLRHHEILDPRCSKIIRS